MEAVGGGEGGGRDGCGGGLPDGAASCGSVLLGTGTVLPALPPVPPSVAGDGSEPAVVAPTKPAAAAAAATAAPVNEGAAAQSMRAAAAAAAASRTGGACGVMPQTANATCDGGSSSGGCGDGMAASSDGLGGQPVASACQQHALRDGTGGSPVHAAQGLQAVGGSVSVSVRQGARERGIFHGVVIWVNGYTMPSHFVSEAASLRRAVSRACGDSPLMVAAQA